METPKEKSSLRVTGLFAGGEAWWLLRERNGFTRVLALTGTEEDAENLYEDFRALEHWQDPAALPSAFHFSQDDLPTAISALSAFCGLGDAPGRFLMAPAKAALLPLPRPENFKADHQSIRPGDLRDRAEFLSRLDRSGYRRADTVEQPGEMAIRGEVLDLWSPGWENPARILWPFNQVESIRKIDMATQRSSDAIDAVLVRPAALRPEGATLLDYLGDGGTLYESGVSEEENIPWPGRCVVRVEAGVADREEPFQNPPPLGDGAPGLRLETFVQNARKWVDEGWRVVVFCRNPGEQERMEEILLERDRAFLASIRAGRIDFPIGALARGFLDPSQKIAVLTNAGIFGRARRRLRLPKFSGGKALSEVAELSKGDYVVHERFGVGRYKGLTRVKAGGVEGDYLRLEYRGGDRVFVPLSEFRQVQKFVGAEGKAPRISSLDTAVWERTKTQVRESVAELARELLARAALRATLPGLAYPPDSHMEKEFAAEFLYELTPDQIKAIEEVKNDMALPRPMDRLVSGDVGYGKTEVAMRAAFKAVAAGRQVVVLVPTTILAEQHGRTFRDRFADFPVSVAVLSRFAKPGEEKRIITDLRRGVIDVVIGTHRLLSGDVAFKNLGLIIVDEEHRFGVKQKERLTAFRDVVDVLALSATPIPRTLGAALGGIKSLSVIATPPEGRLPVATHVGPFDEKIVLAAVENELSRGGQVFYVHNRVGTIEARRRWLEKTLSGHGLSPSIALAHGQMTGAQLEKTMWDFLQKKYNIMLSTSIIESGLDIPSVNTLVVEEAEDFGLSQLYQLRGRVGRERQKAYCYLFHSPGSGLSEDARKRLSALKEFASLGSGFRLALRDLEIRGAGNLLGPQQHGFINAVGVDLYGQLLAEEMRKQKGEAPSLKPTWEPALELPVSAYVPEDYLPSEAERVSFYKRLLDVPPGELENLRAELVDRCGPLPEPAARLFEIAALRHLAREKKADRLSVSRGGLEIRFREKATFSPETLKALVEKQGPGFSFLPGPPFGMRFDPSPGNPLEWVKNFLSTLGQM